MALKNLLNGTEISIMCYFNSIEQIIICVVGLGYVGLPLAVEFGKKYRTIGFDLNKVRIKNLLSGIDETKEVDKADLRAATHLSYTSKDSDIAGCNVYIVTVPTPIDQSNRPDLSPLISASRKLGGLINIGDLVIYESTVYPGATEEDCVPILEKYSGLKFNKDFFVGYSPERINPGDKKHRLTSITKVVSGSTEKVAEFVNDIYSSIISAGTHLAPSIKVAEAAKVIENTQRDINIALMNELAIIFERLEIDTEDVLEAAGTKWNFLNFKPGLVGGHCIGVDPYYLTHKAEAVGYHPQLILAGRRLNDGVGAYVANQMVKKLLKKNLKVNKARLLIMGLTFKENCPDLRNTRVLDVINELLEYGASVDVFDPWCNPNEAEAEYGIILTETIETGLYDGIMICVAHDLFKEMGISHITSYCKKEHVIFDLKHIFPANQTDARL